MEGAFAVWYYFLVVVPLGLVALGGPVLLKQYGLRAVVPALFVLWVAPVVIMHYVVAVPEIFVLILPISEKTINPSVEALICYMLPVWLPLPAMMLAARLKQGLMVQSIVSAIVSAALLLLVSPQLRTLIVQSLSGGH